MSAILVDDDTLRRIQRFRELTGGEGTEEFTLAVMIEMALHIQEQHNRPDQDVVIRHASGRTYNAHPSLMEKHCLGLQPERGHDAKA